MALVLCLAFLMCSCLDVDEEIRIRADGSAHARLHYDFPSAAAAPHGGPDGLVRMLRKSIDQWPQISINELSTHQHRGRTSLRFDLEILDLAGLLEAWNAVPADTDPFAELPSAAREVLGSIRFRQEGRRLEIEREIKLAQSFPGSRLLPASHSRGRFFRHRLHLPVPADETNANHRENAGRTLVWEIPLHDALRGPVRMRATLTAPVPWLSYGLVAFVVLLMIIILIRLFMARRTLRPAMAADP